MNFRGKILITLISVVIAGYAIVGGLFSKAQQPINDAGAQIRIFESVLQHIQNDYVDPPNLEKVRAGALRGLADGLDPYSSYLTAQQVRDFQAQKDTNKFGIGAEFSQVSSYLYIISVKKGSPAETAGLKAGDVIEYIGQKASRDISLYDAKQLILGDPGTKVDLRVLRSGAKPQTIQVTRGNFETPAVSVENKSGNIAVIKAFGFEKGKASQIRESIQDLSKKGVSKIILDLRGIAGGEIEEAAEVANLFIKTGTLAQIIGHNDFVAKTFVAETEKHLFEGEIAILIDNGTAGAAEVVASAVAETKRGQVIGEKSFGAGTEQKLFTLRGGDGFLLTTAKWASSTGKPFLGEKRSQSGVKPTIEVKRPETPEPIEVEDLVEQQEEDLENQQPKPKPSTKEDLQLKKAIEVLQGKVKAKAAGNGNK